MSPVRIAGLVLLVAGIVLLIMGVQATDSLADKLSDTFTGHWTDKTSFFIIGGIAGIIVGIIMAAAGGGRRALSA